MPRSDLWYKNAIIYSLDVETFVDSNGDGVGDFAGLTMRLDYLSALGVTCLWLLPFYPTPNRDNGYDVSDYYGVDSRLGTLGDFVEFLREAKDHGLRVIIDLVIDHTSDQHPWFQSARHDPASPYRDYYIWRQQPDDTVETTIIFTDNEQRPWTYDSVARLYYWHRFYDFEPSLNTSNPSVQAEIHKIMGFWLQLGVDGFRVDAAPYLGEKTNPPNNEPPGPHPILRAMRDLSGARRGDAVLMAESDVEPEHLADYFGGGREMHMLFNFYVNNFLFLALACQLAEPLVRAARALPDKPRVGQWVNWVRNHDELDLERLSESERDAVYRAFAPEPAMRIFNRGIRRRLPPMLAGDRKRIEMAYSLMLSMPGTPIIRYGEEIGMGDDLALPGRESVRTVMQWSTEPNAGFSTAPADKLVSPVISEGPFSYQQVNVASQRRDPASFLNWMERALRLRRESIAIGWGQVSFLMTSDDRVLAHACTGEGDQIIAVHNLSDQQLDISIELGDIDDSNFIELFNDGDYDSDHPELARCRIAPFGYRWFRVGGLLR